MPAQEPTGASGHLGHGIEPTPMDRGSWHLEGLGAWLCTGSDENTLVSIGLESQCPKEMAGRDSVLKIAEEWGPL